MLAMKVFLGLLVLLGLSLAPVQAAESCTAFDIKTGDSYDLSALTKKSGSNWQVTTNQFTYLLNVCDNLLSQTVASKFCTGPTEGCQIDRINANQPAKMLGGGAQLNIKDSGELELRLTGGDLCKRIGVNRSVSILFHCNENAGVGEPKFVEEDDACMYIFAWETAFACPKRSPTPPPAEPKDCMVTDPISKKRYDLTPLSLTSGNWIVNEGEYKYLLNVCGDVHNVPACVGHGACQTKPSNSTFIKQMGLSSGRPFLEEGVLKLKLTGGKSCHGSTVQRSTTIIFTCGKGDSLGQPVFLEETDDCMYIFAWETSAACSEASASQCVVRDDETSKFVDLTPLMRVEGESNYIAASHVSEDTSTYKINLCSGLVSNDNPCREGTSICEIPEGVNTGRSLGNIGKLIASDGDVVMKFSDGDICPGTNERVTSDIYFICDPNRDDSPRLLSNKNDCQYLFNWKTSAACEKKSGVGSQTMSPGAIATIVIFSIIFVYLIGGVAYNRFVRGEKGIEQIPHYSLCQAGYYTISERFIDLWGNSAVKLWRPDRVAEDKIMKE